MTEDLSRYRLKDISELDPFKEKMGEKSFFRYGIRIYERLNQITRDKPFDVKKNVKTENLELFIKIACLFMADYPGLASFNNDFTKITNVHSRKR